MWKTSKQETGQSSGWFEQVLHWYLLSFLFFSFVQTTHLFCGFSFLSVSGTSSRNCRPTLGKDWKICSIVTSSSIWRINNNLNCRKHFFPMTLSSEKDKGIEEYLFSKMGSHLCCSLHTLSDGWVIAYYGIVSVNATHKTIVVINQDRFDDVFSLLVFLSCLDRFHLVYCW